jgi:hypothetical protein
VHTVTTADVQKYVDESNTTVAGVIDHRTTTSYTPLPLTPSGSLSQNGPVSVSALDHSFSGYNSSDYKITYTLTTTNGTIDSGVQNPQEGSFSLNPTLPNTIDTKSGCEYKLTANITKINSSAPDLDVTNIYSVTITAVTGGGGIGFSILASDVKYPTVNQKSSVTEYYIDNLSGINAKMDALYTYELDDCPPKLGGSQTFAKPTATTGDYEKDTPYDLFDRHIINRFSVGSTYNIYDENSGTFTLGWQLDFAHLFASQKLLNIQSGGVPEWQARQALGEHGINEYSQHTFDLGYGFRGSWDILNSGYSINAAIAKNINLTGGAENKIEFLPNTYSVGFGTRPYDVWGFRAQFREDIAFVENNDVWSISPISTFTLNRSLLKDKENGKDMLWLSNTARYAYQKPLNGGDGAHNFSNSLTLDFIWHNWQFFAGVQYSNNAGVNSVAPMAGVFYNIPLGSFGK